MWVHVTHLLSLCDPMTFTYSHSVCDDLISWNWSLSWQNSGDLLWKPNTFQVFFCAGFSSVCLCRYVERVRGVVHQQRDHGQQSGKKGHVLRYVLTRDVRGDTFKNLIKVRQRSVGVRCDYTVPLITSLIPHLLRATLQEPLPSGFCHQYRNSCTKPQYFPRCGNESPTKFCIGLFWHFFFPKHEKRRPGGTG